MFKLFTPFLILALVSMSLLILKERKTFDVRTLLHIDPIPHTKELISEKKYVEAEDYLSFFMDYDYVKKNPKSLALLQTIQTKRNSFAYKKEKLLEGIIKGTSDEGIGQASALASDFLVVGDLRDLLIQGMHYKNDEEVDKFILSLSSLGLLATATTIYSLGATAPIRGTVSILKYGKRANKIPNWLENTLIQQVKQAKETQSLKALQKTLKPLQNLFKTVEPSQALQLLSKSRNVKELNAFTKLATRFGKKSQVLLKNSNYTAINYMNKMPNVPKKDFLYASTYGEQGLKGLQKLGANKFMKRVGFTSNLAKTTYKGNLNALFNALLKHIPNSLLYLISFLGLFYFIRKFLIMTRRIL